MQQGQLDVSTVSVEVGGEGTATRTVTVSTPTAGATSDGGETVTTSGTVDVSTAGVYTVTYSASDAAGNTGTATRTVTVSAPSDTTAPVITLTGDATMSVEVGGAYTEAGATSDGGETVTVSGTVDVSTAGVYTVTYSASDAAGNTGTATRTVTVSVPADTTAPVITLTGSAATMSVEVGGAYTEAGATSDGGETVTIVSGTVDVSTAGVYTVTYSASDAAGNAAVEVVRTVTVVEVVAGENFGEVVTYTNIATTLIGQVTIDGEAAGVGDIVGIYVGEELRGKNEVIVNGGAAWLNAQVHAAGGDETATFKVYDASTGVTHDNIDLSVVIKPEGEVGSFEDPLLIKVLGVGPSDTTAPVITLKGDEVVPVEEGSSYSDAGASASDNVDGDLTGSIVVTSTVDTTTVGSYTVTYNVSDAAGNAAGAVVRTVNVKEGDSGEDFVIGNVKTYTNIATTLIGQVTIDGEASGVGDIVGIYVGEELRGKNEVIVNGGTAWLNAQVHAAGGDETATFKVYDASAGVTYDTIDLSVVIKPEGEVGSFGEPLLIKVVGVGPADTTLPVVTLKGDGVVPVEEGSSYIDVGASASDNVDGDLTGSIVVTSTVDTTTVGSYTVTYNVSDAAGNAAVAVVRTVNVIVPADTTLPVVTLKGDGVVPVEEGSSYSDAGASASDNVDGDLTGSIVVTSTVDTTTVGSYTVTYNVSDAAGNTAVEVVRTVNVVDTTVPEITLNGEATVQVEAKGTYVDAGVSAMDSYDGDLTGSVVTTGTVEVNSVGTYVLSYNVSDSSGNIAIEVRRIVTVGDTGAPVIKLNGDILVSHEAKTLYGDAGASASDTLDGDLTDSIVSTSTVNVDAVGVYTVTYNVSDTTGNAAVGVVRTVSVEDTTAPAITLNGEATVTVEVGLSYSEAGASASDSYDGDLTGSIVVTSTVDTGAVGSYSVTYNVVDEAGNAAEAVVRTVNVVDTTAPVITLRVSLLSGDVIVVSGDVTVTVEAGTSYSDAGANATDSYDGDLTESVEVTGMVDALKVGEYTLTYNVSDAAENAAVAVVRTVNVSDRTLPVITLSGDAVVQVEAGTSYSDAGASASDSADGDLTGSVVTASTVDISTAGSYTVSYSVSDAAGNAAVQVIRTVNVEDTKLPVITLKGDAVVTVEAGSIYSDAGASASDSADGDLAGSVVVTSTVDIMTLGSYTVSYSVSDAAGNAAVQVIRTVNVEDMTAPVITLKGDAVVTVEPGASYSDAGASATDSYDGDLTGSIVTASTVDILTVGSYTVSYSVSDAAGNAVEMVRTVNVEDTTAPVITLLGDAVVTLEGGTSYRDAGASATDSYDGDLTGSVVTASTVNTEAVGSYTVTYRVSDAKGNAAEPVVRKVNVVDTAAPVITLLGDEVTETAFGLEYVDSGATAQDLIEGDVSERITVDSNVDTTKLGTYSVQYKATDKAGNEAGLKVRKVVVEDLVPPRIVLIGRSTVGVAEGTEYKDLGAIAVDDLDGDVSGNLEITSDVDISKAGRYYVRYNVGDSRGNQAIETVREVLVRRDADPPELILEGDAVVQLEAGDTYIEMGALANDAEDGDLSESIVIVHPPSLAKPGDYIVTYDVSDITGNSAPQLTRKIIVTDTTPPLMEIKGDASVVVEAGLAYEDPGVIVTDFVDEDLNEFVQVNNPVDIRRLGEYVITYDVEDSTGNKAIRLEREVLVRDTRRPEMLLVGEAVLELEVGREYSDAGATALDAFEGNLTGSIKVDNQVDAITPGSYTVTYSVSDAAGNAAVEVVRTVNVGDRTAPVITLLGDAVVSVEVGSNYSDAGVSAIDSVDGDLAGSIVVASAVNTATVGSYTVTYSVSDAAGNTAAEVTRVVVVGDTGQPVIQLTGGQSVDAEAGLVFVDPGYFAEDRVDGDLTDKVVVSGDVDTAKIGTYQLAYNVMDSNGNAAIEIVRTVVVKDGIAPQVKLVGTEKVELELGQEYLEEGASAADSLNGDVTASVLIKSSVDLAKPGLYEVSYTAQDLSGNVSEPVIRLVEIEDTTAPSIVLNSESVVQVEAGTQYVDAGAVVNDPAVGDITPRLNVNNPVDVDRLGEYVVTFTASDSSGNRADTVTRSVVVRDTTGPVIILKGGVKLAMEAGDKFFDPGASALDGLDGDLTGKITVVGFVDTGKYGEYELSYTVADNSGNRTEVVRTVEVRDTVPPVLKLLGSTDYQITKGQLFSEPGYEANDLVDGDLSSAVEVLGQVDTSQVGIYELIYTVKDKAGNEAAGQRRTVEVSGDKIAPVIQLIGKSKVVVEAGTPYVDAGATALDRLDGDVSELMSVDNPVDVMVQGQYSITYNAVDRDGNVSEPSRRTVTVQDTTPPVLSLKGDLTVVIEVGGVFVDPGYEAVDSLEEDLGDSVVVQQGVDVEKVGQYIVFYNVSDSAGNAATEASRIVIVGDTGSPIIRLTGGSTIVMDGGIDYVDAGATAEDSVDGDLTALISVNNPVDVNVAGSYQVTYDVEDKQGNLALQVIRTVIIEDHVSPVIELLGDAELEVQAGYEFVDPGVKATDNLDGDLATRLITDSTVNAKVPGYYSIKYLVEDRVGNKAEVKVRTVRVVDTEGPVIALKGELTVQLEAGGSYEEPGASASDLVEGDLSTVVKISGEVDTGKIGTYEVNYQASDSRGNSSQTVVRTITVEDTTPPQVDRIEPLQVLEGKPLQIVVSANDNGRTDSQLTYVLSGAPQGMTLDGTTIRWTPSEEQGPGSYVFDVVVSDGTLEATREVKIEVEEVNAAPVALAAAVVATEDGQVKIQLEGTDIEGSTLTFKVVDLPQKGQLAGSGADLSYVPGKDFNGQDSFTFAVSDGELESASAKVSITVEPVEDAPQITVVENLTGGREDEGYAVSHGALLEASDAFDADGDELTFLITKVSSGTLLDAEGEPLANTALVPGESVNWLPPVDEYGALEAFSVQVADNLGQYAERTVAVTIEVESVPDDPVLKWAKPEGIVYGTALGQVQLSAAADVPGAFEYKPALGVVLKAGNGQSLKAKFTPEDNAEYNVVEARVTIDVALAMPEVSWFNPEDIDAGTALSEVQLNATSDVQGQFKYKFGVGTVFEVREGEVFSVYTLKVNFIPEDDSNYVSVDREVEVTVLPRAPENDAPSILVQPEGFAAVVGGEGQLSVSAVGLKPLAYQWYLNGVAKLGATGQVLKLEDDFSSGCRGLRGRSHQQPWHNPKPGFLFESARAAGVRGGTGFRDGQPW